MGDIINSLTPTAVINSTSPWTAGLFTEMLPWALMGLGVLLAGLFVVWLTRILSGAVRTMFNDKRHGGGWSASDEAEWYAHHKDPNLPWK